MNGPEHYRKAERLIQDADEWQDADLGWKANLSTEERIARRGGDLAAAQVHATLALTAAVAGLDAVEGPAGGSATGRTVDWRGWDSVIGVGGGR